MGSMSASDAAPLPRLGEVYFDVRGESRSMRLSWYADTGGTSSEPARDYLDRPGRGHRDEPATTAYREDQGRERRRAGAHGRPGDDARQGHRDDSLPGGYRGEPGSGHPAPGGDEDAPTGVYH